MTIAVRTPAPAAGGNMTGADAPRGGGRSSATACARCSGRASPSALFLAAPSYGIRQIGYRTENAGAAMADAFARVSARSGSWRAQNGPAATLLVPASPRR